MLTVDPAKRATMTDIKADPWINEGYHSPLCDLSEAAIVVTPEQHAYVLHKMERLGVPREVVEKCLEQNSTRAGP